MQSIESLAPLREIIAASSARYALITPQGILLPCASAPYNPLAATIVTHKPARTRYVNKQPVCRSLNGIQSLQDNARCATCDHRRACTPQIALELLYRTVPFRLMLAYTSAKNFLAFLRTLHAPNQRIEGASVEITILDRGKWGEARFSLTP
jgi:radical SAM protein with 4Fe4S-binding SPASM domain